jgi:hypothetical protein
MTYDAQPAQLAINNNNNANATHQAAHSTHHLVSFVPLAF